MLKCSKFSLSLSLPPSLRSMVVSNRCSDPSSSTGLIRLENRTVDPLPTEWTNEKHSHYLSSVEASFVNDIYRTEHLSKNFTGWMSRIRRQNLASLSGFSSKSMIHSQSKAQRLGRWEKVKLERVKRLAEIENQSCSQSAHQWIQHFRSHSNGKNIDISETNKETTSSELAIQSAHLASLRHEKDATSSKQLPDCPRLCRQNSVNSYTEESGQNFVDEESERREESSISCYSTRKKSSDTSVNDQIAKSGS